MVKTLVECFISHRSVNPSARCITRSICAPRLSSVPRENQEQTAQRSALSFRGTKDDAMEVAIAQRILEFIIEIAAELEDICGSDTDRLIDSLINRPDGKNPFVKMCEKMIA